MMDGGDAQIFRMEALYSGVLKFHSPYQNPMQWRQIIDYFITVDSNLM